jgi:hypothetical protein
MPGMSPRAAMLSPHPRSFPDSVVLNTRGRMGLGSLLHIQHMAEPRAKIAGRPRHGLRACLGVACLPRRC